MIKDLIKPETNKRFLKKCLKDGALVYRSDVEFTGSRIQKNYKAEIPSHTYMIQVPSTHTIAIIE